MAVVQTGNPSVVVIGTAQTGNTDTTDTIDRGASRGPSAVIITSTVGATPTVDGEHPRFR